jgi:hypothetical protein
MPAGYPRPKKHFGDAVRSYFRMICGIRQELRGLVEKQAGGIR